MAHYDDELEKTFQINTKEDKDQRRDLMNAKNYELELKFLTQQRKKHSEMLYHASSLEKKEQVIDSEIAYTLMFFTYD